MLQQAHTSADDELRLSVAAHTLPLDCYEL